jgi:hypothetical protein
MQFVVRARRALLLSAIVVVVVLASPCFGMGKDGHRIIGAIAWNYHSDQAKSGIKGTVRVETYNRVQ